MPDQQAAFLISVATNGLELMSRDFFYARYVGIGLRCQSDHDRAAWSARGYWRVVDSNNTMVIEYVTTTVGAAILYLLPQLGVFVIATNVAESAVSVDRLCRDDGNPAHPRSCGRRVRDYHRFDGRAR